MQGRLTLHVAAILAEIGRHLIAPRVRAGLAATRAQGTVLRRPRKAVDPWSSPNSARKAAHGPRRLAGCESLRAARARVLSSDRVRGPEHGSSDSVARRFKSSRARFGRSERSALAFGSRLAGP